MPKIQQQQQQQRTAYITPSRISKIAPLNTRFGDTSSRRTAAVQPTPQQLVVPLAPDSNPTNWQQPSVLSSSTIEQLEAVAEEVITRNQDQPEPSTSQGMASNNQVANKRVRDEDLADAAATDANNKKPRQLEAVEQSQASTLFSHEQSINPISAAAVEPYSNEQHYSEANEFLITNEEIIQANEVVHEEILIEESESETNDVEESSSNDVLIADQNSQQYYEINEMSQEHQTESSNDLNILAEADDDGVDGDDNGDGDGDGDGDDQNQLETDNLMNEGDDNNGEGSGNEEPDNEEQANYEQDENADENETLQNQEESEFLNFFSEPLDSRYDNS